jgi:hypothetical protein
MNIKSYPEEPFKDALDEMFVSSDADRENFLTTISFFAEQCYEMGNKQNLEPMAELEGYFNWRAVESDKYFKVYFSYFHSEDLLISVNGYEDLTREEYIDSYGNENEEEDCDCNKPINFNNELNNIE